MPGSESMAEGEVGCSDMIRSANGLEVKHKLFASTNNSQQFDTIYTQFFSLSLGCLKVRIMAHMHIQGNKPG